jgi:hypothetical protein
MSVKKYEMRLVAAVDDNTSKEDVIEAVNELLHDLDYMDGYYNAFVLEETIDRKNVQQLLDMMDNMPDEEPIHIESFINKLADVDDKFE